MGGWEDLVAGIEQNTGVPFNARAQKVVAAAEEDARQHNHHRAGDDDLLAALIAQREGVAAKALESLSVDLDDLLAHVSETRGPAAGHCCLWP
jgi:ATP-dependent Clp protease ATP-binding subunit ClpC